MPPGSSRSARGAILSPVVFDDIHFGFRPYDRLAYGQSKTANVLFAVEATRRWADDGITANAVHPGAISDTNLARYMGPDLFEQIKASGAYRYKTPEQGAATSVFVATSPLLEGIGGRYFVDCNETPVVHRNRTDPLRNRRRRLRARSREREALVGVLGDDSGVSD